MSFSSLRVRLLLGAVGFVLAAVVLAAVGLTVLFRDHVERWVDGELHGYLDQVIAGIDKDANGTFIVSPPPADPRFQQPLSGRYWQVAIEPDGPVLRSRSLWDFAIDVPAENDVDDEAQHERVAGPDGSRLYLLQRRVGLPARLDGVTALVAVAVDAAEVDAAVYRFASVLVPFLLLIGALLVGAAWVQVGVGLRPLAAMQRKLADIRAGVRTRLGGGLPDEVQPLASEVDGLLDARDQQVERARARAADLAHGMKTPLQVLLSDAEQLKRKGEAAVAAEIEEIVKSLQRHVEHQLSRARIAPSNPNISADVGEVAARVARVMRRTPDGKRLAWTLDLPPGIFARIDPDDLAEAIGNLGENAVRHASSTVAIAARRNADKAEIVVSDDGPGTPAERWDEMLMRGARLDSSMPGTGLGLAIVKDIADAWSAELSSEMADGRFHVTLSIPAKDASVIPLKAAREA